jgi:hypothetical protein
LRPGRWTSELNFFAWQPAAGPARPDLPEARVRVSVQWREPHDPSFWQSGEDFYQEPLADVRLLILRQRDPTGTKLPADDMEVVARSEGVPLRIDNQPTNAVYEQTVEFTVASPGHYALRVEGRVPATIRPPNAPTLPTLQKAWELRPRLFVRTLNESVQSPGRVLFGDYATEQGNPGMPADAHALLSVGAVNRSGRPQTYSAIGPVFNQALRPQPVVYTFDELSLGVESNVADAGTGLAASFAAGTAASALSAGVPPSSLLMGMCRHPGGPLQIRPAGPEGK